MTIACRRFRRQNDYRTAQGGRRVDRGPEERRQGPFIPLLRSPELMDRLQKVGEYLRFQSPLEPRISELVMLSSRANGPSSSSGACTCRWAGRPACPGN